MCLFVFICNLFPLFLKMNKISNICYFHIFTSQHLMGRERESPGGFCHLSFAHLEEKNKNAKVRNIERKIDKQREREKERVR